MPLKVGPIEHLIKDLSGPLLGLFGADDQHPSPEQHEVVDPGFDHVRAWWIPGFTTSAAAHSALEAAQMLTPASTASRSMAASSSVLNSVCAAAARFSSS
jgi:hypothetical protein